MSYDFGDIVLVPFPLRGASISKKRPAVVVCSQAFQHKRSELIIMAVTSRVTGLKVADTTIADWKEAGLLGPSIVKAGFTTIDQKLALKQLGQLSEKDRSALYHSFRVILG